MILTVVVVFPPPDTLSSELETLLQVTINSVFENISFNEFYDIWNNRYSDTIKSNSLVLNYIMRNFLFEVEKRNKDHESDVIAQALDYPPQDVISLLSSGQINDIYYHILKHRQQFPSPGYGGPRGPRGKPGLSGPTEYNGPVGTCGNFGPNGPTKDKEEILKDHCPVM